MKQNFKKEPHQWSTEYRKERKGGQQQCENNNGERKKSVSPFGICISSIRMFQNELESRWISTGRWSKGDSHRKLGGGQMFFSFLLWKNKKQIPFPLTACLPSRLVCPPWKDIPTKKARKGMDFSTTPRSRRNSCLWFPENIFDHTPGKTVFGYNSSTVSSCTGRKPLYLFISQRLKIRTWLSPRASCLLAELLPSPLVHPFCYVRTCEKQQVLCGRKAIYRIIQERTKWIIFPLQLY